MSATLELSTKLTKGDYTVNVKGLTDEVLTKTVTVEDEKVESIEILSDIAVVNQTVAPTSATVGYQVKNQYGEDITKTTSLTTNSGDVNANPATGVVTLSNLGLNAKVGDKVAIALVHAQSAKSATKTVTLSAAASVSEVAVTGIYNKDGKTLNEDTVLSTDAFYLLVEVKDQYGNLITNKTNAANGLIKSETNPTVIQTDGGNSIVFTDVTIDGKKHLGLKLTNLQKAGESQVTLISTTTGKNASYKIVVAEATRADVVNLSAPALAVAKEDILVPVSVLDKDGKAITDVKVLNHATKGVKVTFSTSVVAPLFVKTADGNLYIKVIAAENQAVGTFPIVAQSSTFKVATSTVKVEKEAVPTTVRGLKKPLTLVAGSAVKDIAHTDVVVEDQYGREMKSADVASYLVAGKEIRVKEDASSDILSLTQTTISGPSTVAKVKAGIKNGTETLTFVIFDGTNEIAASTAEVTVRVTDGTEYKSYEVAPIDTILNDDAPAYDRTVMVYGVLADGSKVLLDNSTDYAVTSTDAILNADVVANGEINVAATHTINAPATEIKLPLTVTINSTGEKINQEITISNVAPKVVKVDMLEEGTAAAFIAGTSNKPLNKLDFAAAGTFTFTELLANSDIVVTDQYGEQVNLTAVDGTVNFADTATTEVAADEAIKLTFSKVSGNVVFTGNGTKSASVTELPTDSVFNAVVTVNSVSSEPVKVTVTGAGYSAQAVADLSTVSTAKGALTAPSLTDADKAITKATLPSTQSGANVTWAITSGGGSITAGVYSTPARIATTQPVVLTATIKKGAAVETKTFTITVQTNVDTNSDGTFDNSTTITTP